MRKYRILHDSLISLLLVVLASCSQIEWEQEVTGASIDKDETLTRSELIEYTINVETAGTLDSLVVAGNYADAQKLIVTGYIAYEDMVYVDENMKTVEVLDMSGAVYDRNDGYLKGFLSSSNSTIKELFLPQGVKLISNFANCGSLTHVILPESVTSLDTSAFSGCSSLTSINIPDAVTYIGPCCFRFCNSLTSVNIPEGVTNIYTSTFEGCSSLSNIILPEGITSIEDEVFRDCSSLISVNIPKNVTSIEDMTFYGCYSLDGIILPDGIENIGDWAFCRCRSLTSINIPDGVVNIGDYAFDGCYALSGSLNIPKGVTNIGDHAFSYSSLSEIILHEGLTRIGNYAYYGCSSLTSINIPEGVTSIGDYAFVNCSSLTDLTFPRSVTSIGYSVIDGCSSLQKLVCNSSVDYIGDLNYSSNLYCWLIINSQDGNVPVYGSNWKNVVIDGIAVNVTLPYRKMMNFTIPEEVKSIKKISYTMNFEENPYTSLYGIWRTIALPFTPTHITHAEKGALAPFNSGVDGAKNFWLKELTADGFENVTRIEPNHPYLIAMPYSEAYADKYNISGKVTFSAENLTSEDFGSMPLSAESTDYTMYASYSYMDETEGLYILNSYNQFVKDNSLLYPFESYVKANTSTLRSVISLSKGRAATRAGGEGKREPQIDDM
jgi:hypothetical protein